MTTRNRNLWLAGIFAGSLVLIGRATPAAAWDEQEEAREDASSERYREQNERWNEEVEFGIEDEIYNESIKTPPLGGDPTSPIQVYPR